MWVFPKASLPPSGRLQAAEISRSTPRWGQCPQVPALGLQMQFSEHKKRKLSTDYLLISGPFINPLILHTYFSGLGWHTPVIILKPLTLSDPFPARRAIFQSCKTRQKKQELATAWRKLCMLPRLAAASKWCSDNSVMTSYTDMLQQGIIMLKTPRACIYFFCFTHMAHSIFQIYCHASYLLHIIFYFQLHTFLSWLQLTSTILKSQSKSLENGFNTQIKLFHEFFMILARSQDWFHIAVNSDDINRSNKSLCIFAGPFPLDCFGNPSHADLHFLNSFALTWRVQLTVT